MTVLKPGARGARTLELSPGQSFAERRRMAWRDLVEAVQLWRLGWALGWLDIVLRYRGSILGPFWLTMSTGVMVGAMGVLYGTLFGMNLREYFPFLAVSTVLWSYLAALLGDACAAYTGNDAMIRSVRMPFTLYAARIVLRNLIVLGHNTVVFIVLDVVLMRWPGMRVVLVLPGLALWLVDSLAITVVAGALCARFRDVPPIVLNLTQLAFFITPVIWKPEMLGNKAWLLVFNPLYSLLEIVRGPILGQIPSQPVYISAIISSVVLCVVSWLLFTRVRSRIAFWV